MLTECFPTLAQVTAVSRDENAPVQSLHVDDIRGPANGESSGATDNMTAPDVVKVVIYQVDQVVSAVAELKKATSPVFGFDMEWQVMHFVMQWHSLGIKTHVFYTTFGYITLCRRARHHFWAMLHFVAELGVAFLAR